MNDVFRGVGVEIHLANQDDFLKIKETLTRIGVSSKRDNILYQSCHILHKQGRYAIVHFKELFYLDGKPSSITESDLHRRNSIVKLLQEWGLLAIVKPVPFTEEELMPLHQIKIISYKDKANWQLEAKYTIGNKYTSYE